MSLRNTSSSKSLPDEREFVIVTEEENAVRQQEENEGISEPVKSTCK